MKPLRTRNLPIDILRLFFAVIIVLHHSRYVLGDENSLFLGGSLAVEFYFFVSGYLLLADVEKAERRSLPYGGNHTAAERRSLPSSGNHTAAERHGTPPAKTSSGTEHQDERADTGRDRPCGIGTETLHFILRKIRSFLPEFLISWIIGFVFVCAAEQYGAKEAAHEFIRDFWELTMVKMSGLFVHGINGVMWYLSAMLLGMAVLYPLLRRHRDVMTHLVCPLLALFCYGYLCRTQNHPRDPVVWLGFLYKGMLRAFAGLCVGIVIRMAVERLQRKTPRGLTGLGAALVTVCELFFLVLPVRYMALHKPGEQDYFYMFLLMLLVLLCFSRLGAEFLPSRRGEERAEKVDVPDFAQSAGMQTSDNSALQESGSYTAQLHRGKAKVSSFLARYSLALYLSHIYFAQHINSILPEAAYAGGTRLAVYLVFSFANGLLVMALSSLWRRNRGRVSASLHRALVR